MKVLTKATVQKVIFKENPVGFDINGTDVIEAEGVEFEHDGKVYVVNAKREVVVTTGYVPVRPKLK